MTTAIVRSEDFDFGREKWGLILVSYSTLRPSVAKVIEALKPGGILVVEAFHRGHRGFRPRESPRGPAVRYQE